MVIRGFLSAIALFVLAGSPVNAEVKVNDHPFEPSFPVIEADQKGNVYAAYYSSDGNLYIKKNNDPETKVSAEGARGEYAALSFFGDDMVLVWRPKFGTGKHVYAQRSTDGGRTFLKPVMLSTLNQAISPIDTASDGKNSLYVVWIDESLGYNFHFNYSTDGGKTFLDKAVNLTPEFEFVTSPKLVVDGSHISLFFMGYRQKDKNNAIHVKQSMDGGKTWTETQMVQEYIGWSPSRLQAAKAGGNMVVVWGGVKGMYGALRREGSKEWEKVEFKETLDMDIYRHQVAADRKGNIYVIGAWRGEGKMNNVYLYRSGDRGITWSGPTKLNRNEYNSTNSYAAVMHAKDDGTVFVAWEDHRDIRGDIYINYSRDFGKTWLERDITIEDNPGKDNSYYPEVANSQDTYSILWTRYTNDTMSDRDVFVQTYRIR